MVPDRVELEPLMTVLACAFALVCLVFVGYLAWRKFGPRHRHRHHHSRMRRFTGRG